MRELVWRLEGRQTDEWRHTMALIASVGNIFAKDSGRFDIRKLIPEHLQQKKADAADKPASAVEWNALRGAFKRGVIRQGR